ncbi:hypothetical protein G7046_g9489 [Stylonectria norvegica]|nr:hypothetical protein G7046_g9489 [Stylonectria norvegica]
MEAAAMAAMAEELAEKLAEEQAQAQAKEEPEKPCGKGRDELMGRGDGDGDGDGDTLKLGCPRYAVDGRRERAAPPAAGSNWNGSNGHTGEGAAQTTNESTGSLPINGPGATLQQWWYGGEDPTDPLSSGCEKCKARTPFGWWLDQRLQPPPQENLVIPAAPATPFTAGTMPVLQRTNSCTDIGFTLRRQFNKDDFRPHQREIIEAALDGHDVYVQAATSFGKSLCFQLPAVIDQGSKSTNLDAQSFSSNLAYKLTCDTKVTIVVSPLLSLMINQVDALRASKIDASSLNSNTPYPERVRIEKDLQTGHPKTRLLYVTPELCSGARFRERLEIVHKQKELARIAIDEAHCISEWGHDFRKDFKRLSWFRETFPDVPIMCLTATANPQVRQDVLATLRLDATPERVKTFLMSPQRANLHLEVRYTKDEDDNRLSDFLRWIRGVYDRRRAEARKSELSQVGERIENVPGIIYTISRDECEYLSSALRDEGVGARPFHAKLPKEVKEETLARWINNEPGYDIIVATTAFGMGIDKNNVRFVVHWRIPKSFEGYYQEAGRAGRDGNASYCFLYYSREDVERVMRMVQSDSKEGSENHRARLNSLQALSRYCENTGSCRHAAICSYFGETALPECDFACDWHKDSHELEMRFQRGLASEEWVSTQAVQGTYDVYEDV